MQPHHAEATAPPSQRATDRDRASLAPTASTASTRHRCRPCFHHHSPPRAQKVMQRHARSASAGPLDGRWTAPPRAFCLSRVRRRFQAAPPTSGTAVSPSPTDVGSRHHRRALPDVSADASSGSLSRSRPQHGARQLATPQQQHRGAAWSALSPGKRHLPARGRLKRAMSSPEFFRNADVERKASGFTAFTAMSRNPDTLSLRCREHGVVCFISSRGPASSPTRCMVWYRASSLPSISRDYFHVEVSSSPARCSTRTPRSLHVVKKVDGLASYLTRVPGSCHHHLCGSATERKPASISQLP